MNALESQVYCVLPKLDSFRFQCKEMCTCFSALQYMTLHTHLCSVSTAKDLCSLSYCTPAVGSWIETAMPQAKSRDMHARRIGIHEPKSNNNYATTSYEVLATGSASPIIDIYTDSKQEDKTFKLRKLRSSYCAQVLNVSWHRKSPIFFHDKLYFSFALITMCIRISTSSSPIPCIFAKKDISRSCTRIASNRKRRNKDPKTKGIQDIGRKFD